MNFSFRSAGYRHGSHTVDSRERIRYVLIKNFVESRHTFRSLHREDADRNHIGRELEDDRVLRVVGEQRLHHIQFVADIVGQNVDIISVFEFKSNHGGVFTRCGGDMLKMLHGIERVLKWFGHILLNILRAGSRIHRNHHDGVRVDVRVKVNRQFGE